MPFPIIPPSPKIRFRCTVSTRWSDEDNMGVLNNAVYLSLLEEARYRYFSHLKLIESKGDFGFVLGETHLRFLKPGYGPAEVTIEVKTTHMGNKSFQQAYRVLGPENSPWVEATAAMVIWRASNRTTAPIPEGFRQAVETFENLPD
ncbi:MAG: acyl-CoA thioesterase [Planctomycetes bacterium]|nr:acyl-CoA thioesterase [Planctomycetota bacterium]